MNPELATRPCGDCQKWVYIEQGEPEARHEKDSRGGKILTRGGKRVKRTTPPPCHACPKKSPELAREYELTDRNIKMYEMYLKSQATGGMCLGKLAHDPMVQRDFAIIHQICSAIRDSRLEGVISSRALGGFK